MAFAKNCYYYLFFSSPSFQQIKSILNIKKYNSSKTTYTFGFFDIYFHDIFVAAFIEFDCTNKLIVNGVE